MSILKMERVFKGVFIPIELWENKELSWDEKALLFEIDSFTKKGRDCYFSDEYIGAFLHCSESTAKRIFRSLIDRGLVRITRKEGKMRYIETCLKFGVEGQNEPHINEMGVKMTADGGQNEPQPNTNDLLFPPIVSDIKISSTIAPQDGGMSKKFVKPSSDDVWDYCRDNELIYVNPEEFVDFYESKGWKVGNSPMKDWKAAARRWNRQNSQKYGAKAVFQPKTKEYPDGTYWLKDFESKQAVVDEFRYDRDMCKRVLQGMSVRRKNGKWAI